MPRIGGRPKSIKKIPIHVWIPPQEHPIYKVEVIRSSGTVDNITDDIISGEVTDGATEVIGSFKFKIDNSASQYTDLWTGGETVNVYMNYGTEATEKAFSGLIEKVSKIEHNIQISGRSHALKLLNITVTKQYENTETSEIIKDLISNYASEFTTNNVETSTTNLTVSWNQKPLWDCIKELCYAADFDCYVDANKDVHYFKSGSKTNTTEAMVHGDNIIEVSDFAEDISQIRNRIIVYGQDIGGLPSVYTAEDEESIAKYGVKEQIITDTNLTTVDALRDRAEAELKRLKDPPIVGEVKSIGTPTLRPGEKLRISYPDSGIPPNAYKIISYTHSFEGMLFTKVKVQKFAVTIPKIMKQTIENQQNISDIKNPYELRYSYNFTFDDDSQIESHYHTEISNGVLKLISGYSSGTMVSKSKTHFSNITQAHLKVTGSGLGGNIEYQLSNDNGNTWEKVNPDELHVFSSTGKKLKLRIILNSSSAQIDSVAILYSHEPPPEEEPPPPPF